MANIEGNASTPNPVKPAGDDLEDDNVKLIAYTIVSLKPDNERIMDGGQKSVVITEKMTGETFVAQILARYLQEPVVDLKSTTMVPRSKLIDSEELKYLRVYYVVSNRWPREPRRFKEREIEALKGIRDELP
jgi:hypothetical protein